VIAALRAVDAVADIHVHAELLAINGADQFQVGVKSIGQAPAHHLDGENGLRRLDGINDFAAVFDGGVEDSLPRFFGCGPYPIVGWNEPAKSTQQREPTASARARRSVTYSILALRLAASGSSSLSEK
jgi:hypothetical protein